LVPGGEIDLDEGPGPSGGTVDLVGDLQVGVGAQMLDATDGGLPFLPGQLVAPPRWFDQADVRAHIDQGYVEPGNGGGVAQEERIGRSLPWSGRRTLNDTSASSGQLPEER
jgi:hypothetical protein